MEYFIYKIVLMSIVGSLIGLIILGIRKLNKTIPITMLSFLWSVFVIFLVIPFDFKFTINIPILRDNTEYIYDYSITEDEQHIKNDEQANVLNDNINLKNNMIEKEITLFIVWISGIGILIFKDLIVYKTLSCKLKNYKNNNLTINSPKTVECFNDIKKTLNFNKKVDLCLQEQINFPAILGILNPKILISRNILNLSIKEQESIFIHELLHLKRYDNVKYLLLNFLKKFYWFNPIISYLIKEIKEDIEVATDKMSVKYAESKKNYLILMLKVSQFDTSNYELLPAFSTDNKNLERRIKLMNKENKFNVKTVAIFCALLTFVTACGVCFASIGFSEKENQMNIESELVSNNDSSSSVIEEKKGTGARIYREGLNLSFDACTEDEVYSVDDGVVQEAGYINEKGNTVVIKHQNSTSEYRHLSTINVNVGDIVKMGDCIGNLGSN